MKIQTKETFFEIKIIFISFSIDNNVNLWYYILHVKSNDNEKITQVYNKIKNGGLK